MKGIYLLTVITAIAVAGCDGKRKENGCKKEIVTTVTKTGNSKNKIADFYGTYKGTLPCADCGGIKTTLKINNDTTYELISEYIGMKDGIFEECGVYRIISGNIIELTTPSSGEKTYYKIIDSGVALSDSTGKTANGKLAKHYILKRH